MENGKKDLLKKLTQTKKSIVKTIIKKGFYLNCK